MRNICIALLLLLYSLPRILLAQDERKIRDFVQLNKYDGLESNRITAIQDDKFDRIWIGTDNGLSIYDSKTAKKVQHYMGVCITDLKETPEGMLIGSSKSTTMYDYKTGRYQSIQYDGYDIKYVKFVEIDKKIFGYVDGEIVQLENGKWKSYKRGVNYKTVREDKFGFVWAVTDYKIDKLDKGLTKIESYSLPVSDHSQAIVYSLFADSKGMVWIGTRKDGLFKYNRALNGFVRENLPQRPGLSIENIGSLGEDQWDRLWIGHNRGVVVLDANNSAFYENILETSDNKALNTTVTQIYRTKKGAMALGSYFTGFFHIPGEESPFSMISLTGKHLTHLNVTANGMVKDHKDRFWMATNFLGVNIFDSTGKFVEQINQSNAILSNNIIALTTDEQHNVWVGSLSNGLFKISPNNKIERFNSVGVQAAQLSSDAIHCLLNIDASYLAVATNNGIDLLDKRQMTFENILHKKEKDFAFIKLLRYQDLLCGVTTNSVHYYDLNTKAVKTILLFENIENMFIQSACMTSGGVLYLGSTNGKLFKLEGSKLVLQPYEAVIGANSIVGIQEDEHRNIWITAGNKIHQIQSDKTFRSYDLRSMMGTKEFNIRSDYRDDKGNLYFGTYDGVLTFNPAHFTTPSSAKAEKALPKIFLGDFRVFNKIVNIDSSSILSGPIQTLDKITLENNENFIGFDVSIIDYKTVDKIPYTCYYRLRNLDDNWYEMNVNASVVSFTGLQTGDYEFELKLEAMNGKVLDSKIIEIQVKPPFYWTTGMKILYVLVLLVCVGLVNRFVAKQKAAKNAIRMAAKEKEDLAKLHTSKLNFFTYIAHEFKNPLSIISTLQKDLFPMNDKADSDTAIFKRSIVRLEFLIGQLLDFRELEANYVQPQWNRYHITEILKSIINAFSPIFNERNIKFVLRDQLEHGTVILDRNKMEMLIGNIIGNILKTTADDELVYIDAEMTTEGLRLKFTAKTSFLQSENANLFLTQGDEIPYTEQILKADIAQAIIDSLVKLLKYQIQYQTDMDQSILTLSIPILSEDDVKITNHILKTSVLKGLVENSQYLNDHGHTFPILDSQQMAFTLLIVEPSNDYKIILKRKLQPYYKIITANTEKEAIIMLKSQQVDLIIAEGILEGSDNVHFVTYCKESEKTKHIPILIISQNNDPQFKLDVFSSGADAYMIKPLDMQELLLRIQNMLKSKDVLKKYYEGFKNLPVEQKNLNNADELFVKEITDYIYNNLEDSNLSVNQMSKHLNISRTQLYLNIKRIMDMTPSSLVLSIKMDQSKILLKTTPMTSSEISLKLGYCSPNHFSKQFKDHFGESPTEFRKKVEVN